MSRARKSAAVEPGDHWLRGRWIFPAGAGLSWVLAQLAGVSLDGELQALRFLFVPLSALVGGLTALGIWIHCTGLADMAEDSVRRRRLQVAVAGLVLGTILLLGLYLRFSVRVRYGNPVRSVAFLMGSSRSGLCQCSEDDATCIQEMGLDPVRVRSCWKDRWIVELALALSYLLTLGSAGSITGLLMVSARPPRSPEVPPSLQGYLDFDVWIDQKSEDLYRARGGSAVGFEATECFTLPAAFAGGKHCFTGAGARRGGLGAALEDASPEQIGGELFRAVFKGELRTAFQGCLDKAQGGPGVRLRLRLNDVPQLANLPWEYLYDAGGRGFLALSGRTPVVRYLELKEVLGTLRTEPPLRVLAVISTPRGYEELAEADEEWRRLGEAVKPLEDSGLIKVERLESPTFAALEARLHTGEPVHVFHFVGHGGFSELWQEGVLVFEDEEGNAAPVGGPSLAYLFQSHPSVRLAVLNACNGARSSDEDTFAGTTQVLIQHGIPAVIAMQSEITDKTACRFAEKFYRALAAGRPVDACIGEVRRALAAEHNLEWGTPVLYLRAKDGHLFSLEGRDRRD